MPKTTSTFNFQEFKKLPPKEMVNYANFTLGYPLGSGISRIVWKFKVKGKLLALKVARDEDRSDQNSQEIEVWEKCAKGNPYFAQILQYDTIHGDTPMWIVAELARPLKDFAEFKKLTGGIPADEFLQTIEDVETLEPLLKRYPKNRWLKGLSHQALTKCRVAVWDIALRNMGIVDNSRLVILDYGK